MKLPSVLFVVFLVLKLTDVINWSWFWVFSPLILGFIFMLIIITINEWLKIKKQNLIKKLNEKYGI